MEYEEKDKIVEDLLNDIISSDKEGTCVEKVPSSNVYEVADALIDKKKSQSNALIDVVKLENDGLIKTIKAKGFSEETINKMKEELAEEVAFLKGLRNEYGFDIDDIDQLIRITEKRTKIIKDLIDILNKEEQIRLKRDKEGRIDFYSEKFQRVFRYLLKIIQDTFIKTSIPSQYIDIFFTELAKALDGFEKKAEKIYYGNADIDI